MLESLENFFRRKLREENNLSEIKNLLYAKANKSNKKLSSYVTSSSESKIAIQC